MKKIIQHTKQKISICITMVLMLLSFNISCFSQNNCLTSSIEYHNTIDTTKRIVYLFVETMPELTESNTIMKFFRNNLIINDSSSCFPLYIYYGFVIEKDSTISNVMICPELYFCNETTSMEKIKKELIEWLTTKLLQQKSSVGILNGEKVAVYTYGRIHLDPK